MSKENKSRNSGPQVGKAKRSSSSPTGILPINVNGIFPVPVPVTIGVVPGYLTHPPRAGAAESSHDSRLFTSSSPNSPMRTSPTCVYHSLDESRKILLQKITACIIERCISETSFENYWSGQVDRQAAIKSIFDPLNTDEVSMSIPHDKRLLSPVIDCLKEFQDLGYSWDTQYSYALDDLINKDKITLVEIVDSFNFFIKQEETSDVVQFINNMVYIRQQYKLPPINFPDDLRAYFVNSSQDFMCKYIRR